MSSKPKTINLPPGEEICITGMSGIFPESDNVEEYYQNLFHKKDLITVDTRRWDLKHPEIPSPSGKINGINHFDEGYFDMFDKTSIQNLDPQCRKLLEVVYEAIIDAGINPIELKDSKVGIFIGAAYAESVYINDLSFGKEWFSAFILQWLGCTGPNCIVDTACSSALTALEMAYSSIRQGRCDSAIVAGSNLCIIPTVTLQFHRLGVLSSDGRCRPFDESAAGYVRSETISAIYLQKAKFSNRIYVRIVYAKNNSDGFKKQGITYPSGEKQFELLDSFYKDCNIDPSSLVFLEAHGTGTVVGDPVELDVIDKIYSSDKKKPFLIGSVKGNLGHCEASSGMCSMVKVLLSFSKGYLLPNIHYHKPRKEMKGLIEGRIKVLTEPQKFDGGLIGISGFGFGGSNSHTLFEGYNKKKVDNGRPQDDIPRLVCCSGRTNDAVNLILNYLESQEVDVEYIRLLHNIFKIDIYAHEYRGYVILRKDGTRLLSRNVKRFDGQRRPLCFLFGDSAWLDCCSIGTLLQVPAFEEAVKRCHEALLSEGIDVKKIVTENENTRSLLQTVVVEIGLVNVLSDAGIEPDYVVGRGLVGELVCAYADGCLTAEQTVLAAYVAEQAPYVTEVSEGNDLQGIKIADSKIEFTKSTDQGFYEKLEKILTDSKRRSKKWVSQSKDHYVTAEYLFNSLQKSASFNQLLTRVPINVLCVKVTPENQTESNVIGTHETIALFQKPYNITANTLLISIGKLYEYGITPQVHKLYPHVEFPVSIGTASISPLIGWNHSTHWMNYDYYEARKNPGEKTYENLVKIDINYIYSNIYGHVIDGRCLFPAMGYLFAVWYTLSNIEKDSMFVKGIVFENVKFIRATTVTDNLHFLITIQPATGRFEICEGNSLIVSGNISKYGDVSQEGQNLPPLDLTKYEMTLKQKDIYKELRLRGYNYKDTFRSLTECDATATVGRIRWSDWISFMDNMLQMLILRHDNRGLFVPTRIRRVVINSTMHADLTKNQRKEGEKSDKDVDKKDVQVPVYVYKNMDIIRAGGVEIHGLYANAIARRKQMADPVLETYQFVPYRSFDNIKMETAVRLSVHVVLENLLTRSFKCIEIDDGVKEPTAPILVTTLGDLPLIQADVTILSQRTFDYVSVKVENKDLSTETDCVLVVGSNLIHDSETLSKIQKILISGGFILTREQINVKTETSDNYSIVLEKYCGDERLILIRAFKKAQPFSVLQITEETEQPFDWLEKLQKETANQKSLVLFSQNEPLSGIQGLVNCIRCEPGKGNVRSLFILDPNAPPFDPAHPFYKTQLDLNLAMNVYKDGTWGSFRHVQLEICDKIKTKHAFVNVTTRGDLSSLKWLQGSLNDRNSETMVEIYYSSLNFRDIMTASGKLAVEALVSHRFQETVQGLEYSGRDQSGRRVMGMVLSGALATRIEMVPHLSWEIPDDWTFEDAATVPVVYGTVLLALVYVGELQRGESVLIHAGSGGVGQAAITVALHRGCTVFTTVGTPEKRNFIKERFPQLNDYQIGNSRDTSFEQMIMKETGGRGVDIVLNSLAEEKLQASLRCLAPNGRFLEIGKFDMANNNTLQVNAFSQGQSFHSVMLDNLFYAELDCKQRLHKLLADSLRDGEIKPLTRTVFKEDQIEQAFRFMAAGKHIGKVLIKIREEEEEKVIKAAERTVLAQPRVYFDSSKSYIITGGLGGFGLELADWMVLRGVRKLLLVSRNGVTKGYQRFRILSWEKHGIKTLVSTEDITTSDGCEKLIKSANTLGSVGGIFNLAVVLQDAIFENQTVDKYIKSFGPKAFATKHLDMLSRKLCPDLDHFVIFSSVSCGRGNAGQTNYGMANSVMERICEKRRTEGLPGLAIQWGAIGDVGLVADKQEQNEELVIGGTLSQRISGCIELLDVFFKQNAPVVSSMVVAEKSLNKKGTNIIETVLNILGIKDIKLVSMNSTLTELGVDSMMTNEIKESLARDYAMFLTNEEIQALTFGRLAEITSFNKVASTDQSDSIQKDALKVVQQIIGSVEDTNKILVHLESLAKPEDDVPTVFALPGIEGYAKIFEPLAKKLNVHFKGLQPVALAEKETIEERIECFLQIIKSNMPNNKQITILAYSMGSIYGIGLMNRLEAESIKCNLCIVDGSPTVSKQFLHLHYGDFNAFELENELIGDVVAYFMPQEIDKLRAVLNETKDLEARLQVVYKILSARLKKTNMEEIFRSNFHILHNSVRAIQKTDFGTLFTQIKSPVILIRQKQAVIAATTDDLGLNEFVQKPVPIVFIDSTHLEILSTNKCASEVSTFIKMCGCSDNKKLNMSQLVTKSGSSVSDEKTI